MNIMQNDRNSSLVSESGKKAQEETGKNSRTSTMIRQMMDKLGADSIDVD